MVQVDLNELKRCVEYMRSINNMPFYDIMWTDGDNMVIPDDEEAKKIFDMFEDTGLNNTDYGKMLLNI